MRKKLCIGMICAIVFAGLTACGSADIPTPPTNPPANHSEVQSSEADLLTSLLPEQHDAPETSGGVTEPEDAEHDSNATLQLPESEVPSVKPGLASEGELSQQSEPVASSVIQEHKILIAYFTWAENTVVENPSEVNVDATTSASVLAPGHVAQMAAWIQAATGGDLFSIVTAEPYSSDYDECLNRAADEKAANTRPTLTETVGSMSDYDVIFLGYPDWWSTCPMAVFTFLDSYDFTGKTVIPFCAHGTSGLAASVRDIRAALPGVTVMDAVGVQRPGMDTPMDTARSTVLNWLAGLKY